MPKDKKIFIAKDDDCTAALQADIDIAAASGQILHLPRGIHRCGALRLPTGTHLHLDDGAVLKFHPGYDIYADNRVDVIAEDSDRALLLVEAAHNIRISGSGHIEAPGESYVEGMLDDMGTYVPARRRPRTLVVNRCHDVVIEGITLRLSAMWTVHVIKSVDVTLKGISITNDRKMPNTDGIVVDACTNVLIDNCGIETADDGVVLKTSRTAQGAPLGACRDITVSNCRIISESCALKLGTESFGPMEDITFRDCRIEHSNRALGIFSRDGGRLARISFQRIDVDCHETPEGFWGSGEAITVNCLDRRNTQPAGRIEHLLFEDVTGTMQGAINLVSDKPGEIRDVTLRRVTIEQTPGPFNSGRYDVRPTRFDLAPSPDAAGRANAWVRGADGKVIGLVPYPDGMPGLFAMNIEGLRLDAVNVSRPSPLPDGFNRLERVILDNHPPAWS